MEKKKFLITGITGHISPHLANILIREGHEVFGLSRRTNGSEIEIIPILGDNFEKVTFLYGDLLDLPGLNKIFQTYVFHGCFHCGAQSSPSIAAKEPVATMMTNVMGTTNIVQAISDYQPSCKLLFVSTSEVYGDTIQEGQEITEDHPLSGGNPYSCSKIASDIYIQERIKHNKINAVITRAFSHLAPGRGKNFSISSDAYGIARILLGKQEKILKVGNLNTIRVVIDARDVAEAYYLLMMNDKADGQVFNVAGTVPHCMEYYTNLLIELAGFKEGEIKKEIYKPYWRDIEIFHQAGNSSKLRNLTGWSEKIDIRTTLQDVLSYWIKKLS